MREIRYKDEINTMDYDRCLFDVKHEDGSGPRLLGEYGCCDQDKPEWNCPYFKSIDKDRQIVYYSYEEKHMFKVGDRVKIIDKGTGPRDRLNMLGTIDVVYWSNDPDNLHYRVKFDDNQSWYYKHSRFELITEDKMEYKLLKPITLQAILDAGAQPTCSTFKAFAQNAFAGGYGPNQDIPIEKALEWKKTEFLFEKGFIEQVKEEVFYKIGDKFNFSGELHQIIPFGGGYQDVYMANLSGGISSFDKNKVVHPKDRFKITVSEFKDMVGSCFNSFTKIED